jgi:hypothetical protein
VRALGAVDVLALVALGVTVLGVLWCAFFLMRVLMPRMRRAGFSRYSVTTLSTADVRRLVLTSPEGDREEAWRIAITLAGIVEAKYRAVRLSLYGWMVAAAALLCWIALSLA